MLSEPPIPVLWCSIHQIRRSNRQLSARQSLALPRWHAVKKWALWDTLMLAVLAIVPWRPLKA